MTCPICISFLGDTCIVALNLGFIHVFTGQFLGDVGRLHESVEMYRSILDKDDDNFEMVFNAANIFRQVQDNVMSEKLFEKASLLKPNVRNILFYVI